MIELKNNPAGNFFLLAGPCVIEGEDMAMRIAERVVAITDKLLKGLDEELDAFLKDLLEK